MVRYISGAMNDSEGISRQRTSHASALKARCKISGTGAAPLHTQRSSGHRSGSTWISGTSTSENRKGFNGSRPGTAIV